MQLSRRRKRAETLSSQKSKPGGIWLTLSNVKQIKRSLRSNLAGMHKKATTNHVYKRATLRNNEWVTVILLGALAKGAPCLGQAYLLGGKEAISNLPSTVERTRQAVNQQ